MIEKIKRNITSRAFIPLIVGVVAFFTTTKFPDWALLSVMGLYCGYNLSGKFIEKRGHDD